MKEESEEEQPVVLSKRQITQLPEYLVQWNEETPAKWEYKHSGIIDAIG